MSEKIRKVYHYLGIILLLLVIVLIFLEIIGARINYRYFDGCGNTSGRFDLPCNPPFLRPTLITS